MAYYLQTGNILLRSPENPGAQIATLIKQAFGFDIDVFVFTREQFVAACAKNPFQDAEGKFVHISFCKQPIQLDEALVTRLISPTETFFCSNNVFYFHAPDGVGRSKLVAKIESCLQQPTTARNLNTVNKLKVMLEGEA